MKKYMKAELKDILEKHLHWLREDCDGWEDMRADLFYADLSYADLSYANLSRATLSGADLSYANLSRATLSSVDLSRANLSRATLSGADLSYANLSYANLSYADLSGVDLSYATLSGANLSDVENIPYIPMACPDHGAFIGFKKAQKKIIKLKILKNARRSSAAGRKCRCDAALVLEIQNLDGSASELTSVASDRSPDFVYTVGKIVREPEFCEDRWRECAPGIHFFINREEAVQYC